jgi:1,4-dihydroxy-2-naphthoate octaprenyltransferase
MNKVKLWFAAVRAPFFTASIVPVLLGAAIAWDRVGVFEGGYFLLTLIGAICLHAGANVINDYFDHLSRADDLNVEFVRPFTGGSRMIQSGLLTPWATLIGALIFFAIGSIIGLYLAYARGPAILVIGIIGVFSGFFYTAPPIYLAAIGLGELFIGLNFGLLMTLGSYYVQTQQLSWEPIVAAIPVALLLAAVLYINEFQDAPADHAADKDHLVVRLGRKRAATGYAVIMLATYLSILLAALTGITPPFTLLGLMTLPITWQAIRVAQLYYDDNLKLAPANANTVLVHLLTGLLLTVGYLIAKIM